MRLSLICVGVALYLAALAIACRGAAGAFMPWRPAADAMVATACLALLALAMVFLAIGLEGELAHG